MSFAQPASLVLAGLTASGVPLVQAVVLAEGSTATHSSFHRISSFGTFPVEEQWSGNEGSEEQPVHVEQIARTDLAAESLQNEQELPKEEDMGLGDEGKPVACSEQFERKRTASLAAALLSAEHAPGHKAIVQFVSPSGDSALIEACETAEDTEEDSVLTTEIVIANLLFTLKSLQMSEPDRHANALRRLQDLEQELRAVGVVCPPDSAVSSAVAKALANASMNSDVQIRVNSSRQTTTTKTVFEAETPGMEGLDTANIQRLQQQLISDMSQTAAPHPSTEAKTSPPVTDQKHESMAEGFTSEDGSVVVSKKMTRVVTTTRTTIPGEAESNVGE